MYMYYQNLSFGSIDFIMKILTGRYLFDSANGFIINHYQYNQVSHIPSSAV